MEKILNVKLYDRDSQRERYYSSYDESPPNKDPLSEVRNLLDDGWEVKSMVPYNQSVSIASDTAYRGSPNPYRSILGDYGVIVVLKKD